MDRRPTTAPDMAAMRTLSYLVGRFVPLTSTVTQRALPSESSFLQSSRSPTLTDFLVDVCLPTTTRFSAHHQRMS